MRSVRLWPSVSPSPDAASRDASSSAGVDIAAIFEELCAMRNREAMTNVMCYVFGNDVCSTLFTEL